MIGIQGFEPLVRRLHYPSHPADRRIEIVADDSNTHADNEEDLKSSGTIAILHKIGFQKRQI